MWYIKSLLHYITLVALSVTLHCYCLSTCHLYRSSCLIHVCGSGTCYQVKIKPSMTEIHGSENTRHSIQLLELTDEHSLDVELSMYRRPSTDNRQSCLRVTRWTDWWWWWVVWCDPAGTETFTKRLKYKRSWFIIFWSRFRMSVYRTFTFSLI